jgi:hypothetical protein
MGQPISILFLTASPSSEALLAVGREARAIDERLRASKHRDCFRIEQARAVRASDLSALLQRYDPAIVHFSGHGSDEGELLLEDDYGDAKPVTREAIGDLFRILGARVRCVVLNACYSEAQAEVIAQHVDCVVGMSSAVEDATSIAFAEGFYQALGFGNDVRRAFEAGCLEIGLTGGAGPKVPKLCLRSGVDAGLVNLVAIATSGSSGRRTDDASGAPGVKSEPLAGDLAALTAALEERLRACPALTLALADKLGITKPSGSSSSSPGRVARALIDAPGKDVATILADLDATLDKDRDAVRSLLWQTLPFAVDWRELLLQSRSAIESNKNALELPLRTETLAEIVLAGADGRQCQFSPDGDYPQGVGRIRMPAATLAPFFHSGGERLVEALVLHLCREEDPGDLQWTNLKRRFPKPSELSIVVEKRLRNLARKGAPNRLPHYLLFIDAELEEGKDMEALWGVARAAFGKELPSLRLVRLRGGLKELDEEADVAEQILAVRDRR